MVKTSKIRELNKRQDKSRASLALAMVGFLRLWVYGTAQKSHTRRAKPRAAARFSYGIG